MQKRFEKRPAQCGGFSLLCSVLCEVWGSEQHGRLCPDSEVDFEGVGGVRVFMCSCICTGSPWEMRLTWASSAAFVPVVSRKAATPDWPLGLLCSASPDIEKEARLPSAESQDGHQRLSLETA